MNLEKLHQLKQLLLAAIARINDLLEHQRDEFGLTTKQELFCQLYASDRQFFGNGVQAYIAAYNVDVSKPGAYHSARSSAYENLTKPDILKRINQIFEGGGLNVPHVDKQLEFLITQNANFNVKLGAIKEFNALKQRITKKLDVTSEKQPITALVEFI